MKYSSVEISDNNADEEMEKLADQNKYSYDQYIGFYDRLDDKFCVQQSDFGYDEWICQKVLPNHSIDCISPIVESVMAYEFGNGFMLFGEHDLMFE